MHPHYKPSYIDDSAHIAAGVEIGSGTKIWANAQIRNFVRVGMNCTIGKGVYLDTDVVVGDDCKIQNGAQIFGPSILGNGVFVGPGAILTNDKFPRAVNPDFSLKKSTDWKSVGVTIGDGASIGAGVICISGISIGAWAMIGAGALVNCDVPNFGLLIGSPAKQKGWVGKSGHMLFSFGDNFKCPITHELYKLVNNVLTEIGNQ